MKIFLVSLVAATGLFAAPEATPATANTAAAQAPAAATPAVQTAPARKIPPRPLWQRRPHRREGFRPGGSGSTGSSSCSSPKTPRSRGSQNGRAKAAPVTPVAATPANRHSRSRGHGFVQGANSKTEASSVAAAPLKTTRWPPRKHARQEKQKQPCSPRASTYST